MRRTAARAQSSPPYRLTSIYLAQGRGAGVFEPGIFARNAGAVHEMRERPELRNGGVKDALDVRLDRHVALDRDRLAAGGLHRLDHAAGGLGIALVVDRHVVAAAAGKSASGGADAAAAAGNQKNGS